MNGKFETTTTSTTSETHTIEWEISHTSDGWWS